jgi:hypothetical protein
VVFDRLLHNCQLESGRSFTSSMFAQMATSTHGNPVFKADMPSDSK